MKTTTSNFASVLVALILLSEFDSHGQSVTASATTGCIPGAVVNYQFIYNGGGQLLTVEWYLMAGQTDINPNGAQSLNLSLTWYSSGQVRTFYAERDQSGVIREGNIYTDFIGASPGTISGTPLICLGGSGSFTISGNTGLYTWQRCAIGCSTNSDEGWSSTTNSYTNLTVPTQFRAKLGDTPCGALYSNTITVNFFPNFNAGTISNPIGTPCASQAILLSSSADASGGDGIVYKWQKHDGSGFVDVVGANLASYAIPPGQLAPGGTSTYRRLAKDGSCQTSFVPSNELVVVAGPFRSLLINDPGPRCDFTGLTFTAVATVEGANPVYRWYRYGGLWDDANPSTEVDHNAGSGSMFYLPTDPNNPGQTHPNYKFQEGEKIRCVLESTTGCPARVTSNEVVIDYQDSVTPTINIVPTTYSICSGESVTFAASTSHSVIGSITWSLGSIPQGTGSQFTITNFQSLSSYDVSASATVSPGPGQCLSTPYVTSTYQAANITVTLPVNPGAIGQNQTICRGSTPTIINTLDASGGSGAISYQWQSLPNGAPVWANIPGATLLTYTPLGPLQETTSYRRTATSYSCSATTTAVTAVVVERPSASLVINDPGQRCDFNGVSFTAIPSVLSPEPIYRWYRYMGVWNDASPPPEVDHNTSSGNTFTLPTIPNTNEPIPTYKFQDGEKIRCVAEFNNNIGCGVNSNEVIIDYQESITPTISIVPNTYSICSGASVTFTASTSHTVSGSISWSLGGIPQGTGSEFTITNFQNLSSYDISASATVSPGPGQCLSTPYATSTYLASSITVTLPVDPGVIGSDQLICEGTRPTLTNSAIASGGSGTITYQWQFWPEGAADWANIHGATLLTYSPAALSKTTRYRRIALNNNCDAKTDAVTVTVRPIPHLYSVVGGGPVCSGNDNGITLTHSDTGVNYQLFLNGAVSGPIREGTDDKIEWAATATGKYSVEAIAECTRQMAGVANITSITPLPTTANAGADRNLCSVNYIALAGNYATSGTGLWTVKTGGAIFEDNTLPNSNVYLGGGTNTLIWTISNGPCKSADEVTINVANAPTSISFSSERMMCAMKFTAPKVYSCTSTYSWDFGDGQTSTERNPLHVYASAGTYPVTMTVHYNCATICIGSLSVSSPVVFSPSIGELDPITLQVATDERKQVLSNSASTFSDSWPLQHEAEGVSNRMDIGTVLPVYGGIMRPMYMMCRDHGRNPPSTYVPTVPIP
jgi:PKD repeat protein